MRNCTLKVTIQMCSFKSELLLQKWPNLRETCWWNIFVLPKSSNATAAMQRSGDEGWKTGAMQWLGWQQLQHRNVQTGNWRTILLLHIIDCGRLLSDCFKLHTSNRSRIVIIFSESETCGRWKAQKVSREKNGVRENLDENVFICLSLFLVCTSVMLLLCLC